MRIAPLLKVGRGLTALIGAGGKTTLMETLADELRAHGSVILCTSTKILAPKRFPVLTDGDGQALRDALGAHGAVCVGTPFPGGKLSAPALGFDTLCACADYVLVEADGAHRLPLKAHAPHEPVIPDGAQRVVLVLGASGFGRPIRAVCHRPERYAALAGVSPDEPVTPELAARVIRAEGLGDRVCINQVEDPETYRMAAELARLLSVPVVAGSLWKGVYTCLS